jgi:hypothetical protein
VAVAADVAMDDVQPGAGIQLGVLQALGGIELAVGAGGFVEDLGEGADDVVVDLLTALPGGWGTASGSGQGQLFAGAKVGHLFVLPGDVDQALVEPRHLASPASIVRLANPLRRVLLQLDQAVQLRRIDPEEGTAHAGVLVDARRAVRPPAVAEGNFAESEMFLELDPFSSRGLPVLIAGALGSTASEVGLEMPDDLLRVDGEISLSRLEIEVAEERRSDVDGQPAADDLGGEDGRKSWAVKVTC